MILKGLWRLLGKCGWKDEELDIQRNQGQGIWNIPGRGNSKGKDSTSDRAWHVEHEQKEAQCEQQRNDIAGVGRGLILWDGTGPWVDSAWTFELLNC